MMTSTSVHDLIWDAENCSLTVIVIGDFDELPILKDTKSNEGQYTSPATGWDLKLQNRDH